MHHINVKVTITQISDVMLIQTLEYCNNLPYLEKWRSHELLAFEHSKSLGSGIHQGKHLNTQARKFCSMFQPDY